MVCVMEIVEGQMTLKTKKSIFLDFSRLSAL